jgi:hypothetical protein
VKTKPIDVALGNRIITLRERVVANFDAGNWEELGLLTSHSDTINHHHRLLRSLHWNDEDYAGNALTVLRRIVEDDPRTLPIIEAYLDDKFPGESHYVSAKPAERKITFAPHVFQVPEGYVELDLAAVMMPFSMDFSAVHAAIRDACAANNLRCQRVDDIWEESVIVQEIFNLIYRAQVVVVDFTGRNPNVLYETGIAHTLGKHVIPVTQSIDDVPFDLRHHRVQKYLANNEGLAALRVALGKKLEQFAVSAPSPSKPEPRHSADDDIPF